MDQFLALASHCRNNQTDWKKDEWKKREDKGKSMEQISEPVPPALRLFLQEVAEQIRVGSPSTKIPSDDLLQCDVAYGGLLDQGGTRYGFAYFHSADRRPSWYLMLESDQIQKIADGIATELLLWKCDLKRCPTRSTMPDFQCSYCEFWENASVSRPKTEEEGACNEFDDWLALFTRVNPWATGVDAYNAYRNTPGLEERLGEYPAYAIHRGRLA
ncbi:MAG: hypothetical protein MUC43_14460 [Pirellula sp.]|nr:hypothetical protein [Pirellula sp.]